MKFAQYLRDTQTPEWKKAYIDYRGLKKRITAIRKAQHGLSFHVSSSDSPDELPSPPDAPQASEVDSEEFERSVDLALERFASLGKGSGREDGPSGSGNPGSITSGARRSSGISSFRPKRGKSFSSIVSNGVSSGSPRLQGHPFAALPLHELLTQLSPHEISFFTLLDAQLDKVESFYLAREKEMLARGHTLQIQLNELSDHRKLFLESHTREPWTAAIMTSIRNIIGLYPPSKVPKKWHIINKTQPEAILVEDDLLKAKSKDAVVESKSAASSAFGFLPSMRSMGKRKDTEQRPLDNDVHDNDLSADDHARINSFPLSYDPDSYLYAKRRLKKAVIEHYRGLEMLHNYRVLNITGFRKALKKFEKVTKIPVQQQYMTEKVDKSAFASDKAIHRMMTQMEDMYAKAFVRGDKKKAMKRLRGGGTNKNHHFSTFRSGVLLGLATPAVIDGIVKVFQPHTREAIPRWDVLLYIYGIMLVPVLFTLLVGLNLVVWANARINYVFIFEIDVLTQLDHRKYFETPSILLAALAYAFWLSFSDVGPPVFTPTTWPLIWLLFAFIVVFNPFPIMFRSSRYWLIKHVAELFISGTKHVEFTDFWMGDQFCSLTFTLSNIFFFVCVYVDNFSPDWQKCNVTSKDWPIAFIGAALPLFIRLVQSVKRYKDSNLITHLINGGKYGSGILSYLFFFMWRHHQVNHGTIFALYILTSINYSIYALSWDLLMDWSVFRLHSPHFLLRPELVYTNYVPLYYFAIVTNILIRFSWVIYVPHAGPSMMLRSFIAGMLEMLRRWQWNFVRLENEHLGNMDQYRVTREVPLPYAIDERRRDYDDDDDDHLKLKR